MRISSPPSVSFSIVKGGVLELFKSVNLLTSISISPVGIFLLRVSSDLGTTFPVTVITLSEEVFSAIEKYLLFLFV